MRWFGLSMACCFLLEVALCAHHQGTSLRRPRSPHTGFDEDPIEALERYLFPNRTAMSHIHGRRLAIPKPPYVAENVHCSFCPQDKMKFCRVLRGLMMEETYLPRDTSKKEVCAVTEALAARMSGEIFGNGRSFRDTPDCRNMVMQYLCLTYGSNNDQYRNYCYYKEKVDNVDVHERELTARAPCRGFCIQVATVCAYDPTFIQTCTRIPCPPPKDMECAPDPLMGPQNETLATNIGCNLPFHRTPYNSATSVCSINIYLLSATLFLVLLLVW